jgi:predicted transcriptional regulator of viral defense system
MASIKENIKGKIKTRAKGTVWTTSDFTHTASVESVKKALLRLTNEGFLVRIARGLYLYPKYDLEMGRLSASLENVADANPHKIGLSHGRRPSNHHSRTTHN